MQAQRIASRPWSSAASRPPLAIPRRDVTHRQGHRALWPAASGTRQARSASTPSRRPTQPRGSALLLLATVLLLGGCDGELARGVPGCFQQKGQVNPCPHCGDDATTARPVNALAPGTVLNDQFSIGRMLGKPGGFGITYLALDQHLRQRVAIKEYLPGELATRGTDRASVVPHTTDEAGLRSFPRAASLPLS